MTVLAEGACLAGFRFRFRLSGWLAGRKEGRKEAVAVAQGVAELGSAGQQVVSVWSRFSSRDSASHISNISRSGWSALHDKNLTLLSFFKKTMIVKKKKKKEEPNELLLNDGRNDVDSTPLPLPTPPAELWGLFEVHEQFKVNSIVP